MFGVSRQFTAIFFAHFGWSFDVNQLCDVPAYRGLLLFALAAHDRDIFALVGVCGEFSVW